MKKTFLIIFLFLSVFSFSQEKKFKVVLDAGHGGKDPGAAKNGCVEKLIALDVVLRIGKILESYPDFNIKYTRSTDVFIPLKDRAKIANDFEADLAKSNIKEVNSFALEEFSSNEPSAATPNDGYSYI